ncbi:MAG: hypothetical protein RML15_08380 [Bacteroidota bacterium]|nr:hypothetical protein [Candidatus Kapabacteria bacterium]MDW8272405.1 hypothetical protein [Bacteroidota bacterium]
MAKGGAGKVYFVLYLAVILELLIIIVERDEAEEHLIQKQKESMKIVESILSQLQVGTGTEGISTRPQDEITLQDASMRVAGGPQIKQDRLYEVIVGVTDVSTADKLEGLDPKEAAEKMRNLIKLANVQELDYQIFYHPSNVPDRAPPFPSDDSLRKMRIDFSRFSEGQEFGDAVDGARWKLLALERLELQVDQVSDYRRPVYKSTLKIGDIRRFAPPTAADSAFIYLQNLTDEEARNSGGRYKKRYFLVRFQPAGQPGWYKLRFASRTNRILGVRSDVPPTEVPLEEKVNIGTVQLKIKDLLQVKKNIVEQLSGIPLPSSDDLAQGKITVDEFDEQIQAVIKRVKDESDADDPKAQERMRRIELYSYIAKLLAPGASAFFDQNRASYAINVRVVKPNIPPPSDPVVYAADAKYVFDRLPRVEIPFTASPYDPAKLPTVRSNPVLPVKVVDVGPAQQAAASSDPTAQARNYKIVIEQSIPAGDYELTITHANRIGKTTDKTVLLKSFESKLENLDDVRANVENCYFGSELEILPVPADGKKISAGQYLINAIIGNEQSQPVRGLQYRREIPCGANSVSVDILWEDPDTKERVSLLPSGPLQGTPKQRPPKIVTTDVKYDQIVDPRVPVVVVKNIKILPPIIDVGGAKAGPNDIFDFKVVIQKADIAGYKVTAQNPRAAAGGYEVELRLDGPPLRRGKVEGNVTLIVSAKAKNKCNGEVSADGKAVINVPITY